jgi:hypothetical protein
MTLDGKIKKLSHGKQLSTISTMTTLCRALLICSWFPGVKELQGDKIRDGEGRFDWMYELDCSETFH